MRSLYRIIAWGMLGLSLGACQAPPQRTVDMPPCEALNTLLAGHANGFAELRGERSAGERLPVWRARYDLVGEHCRIWENAAGKAHYVCNEAYPEEVVALERYDNARTLVRGCLGGEWTVRERPRQLGQGVRTLFQKGEGEVAIELHKQRMDGLLRDHWTVYLLLGEPTEAP